MHHTTHLKAAAQAGKDAYCEKPLAMDFDKLKDACDAVKKANIVVQIGTQLRSLPSFTGCRELYKTGILGRVSRIAQRRNNEKPYWYNTSRTSSRRTWTGRNSWAICRPSRSIR